VVVREVEEEREFKGSFAAHKATPHSPSMVVMVAVVRRRRQSGGEGG